MSCFLFKDQPVPMLKYILDFSKEKELLAVNDLLLSSIIGKYYRISYGGVCLCWGK